MTIVKLKFCENLKFTRWVKYEILFSSSVYLLTGSNHRRRAQFKCVQTVVGHRFAENGPNGLSYYYVLLLLLLLHYCSFADDTTVFTSDSDINGVHASVNRELVGVDNCLKTNRLSLNVSKTSYMIISNKKNALDIKIRKNNPYESFNTQIPWRYVR